MASRPRVLWLVPLLLAIHNAEEALLFPRYLPLVLSRLPEGWRALAGAVTLGQVGLALALLHQPERDGALDVGVEDRVAVDDRDHAIGEARGGGRITLRQHTRERPAAERQEGGEEGDRASSP